ncbi:hypothetical protein LX69_01629 [Breznakibacter xylanolyticus]|uniref:Fimbrillin-like protein n=1 Tax=Breznakibacter xylanolyticus TaxID=990 RepID=A0A2W7N8T7_9BACT|nr:hypothetical protein [Breznakibacter xylanolyticus]PZX16815.1 hypothetical protein LX69_01629 [Breznakibacter xylanolyticus]
MKTKILSGLLSLTLGFFAISCGNDEDFSVATGNVMTEITTGSADVTANSAVMHGTVKGLEKQSPAAYVVGVKFGTSQDNLSELTGSLDGNTMTVSKTGLTNNTTYYYQAYVTLQGKVTYTGEVKTLVTTNAKVATKETTGGLMKATLGGTITDYPTGKDISCGIVISLSADDEAVRAGLIVANSELSGDFSFEQKGLLPGKTYYYAAYLNLGSGIVYGDVKSFTTTSHDLDVDDDFVDLGLSRKWGKYNLGASKAAEYGGLFAYGDLTGLNNSTNVSDYGQEGDIYLTNFDISHATYSKTTLPTASDFVELFNSCTYVWKTIDDVTGYEFTGPNGNKLFLPAAGSRTGNTISNKEVLGNYLTGSINKGNKDFNQSFTFGNGYADKGVSPRYTALAVRPVSTARKVALQKELMKNTWMIDIDVDGASVEFVGPVYFYGTQNSWATETNYEPVMGAWAWKPTHADTKKICPAKEYGSMKFEDDGKVTVTQIDAEGKETIQTGTYIVDETEKTVTLDIDILTPYTFSTTAGEGLTQIDSKQTKLKILSLTETAMQIAVVRTEDPCLLSINYVTDIVKNGYKAKLTCYGIPNDAADAWSSAMTRIAPIQGNQYTVKFTGQRNAGEVYIIDVENFAKDYPSAVLRVDDIKVDGSSISYDANKFFFGDIEGNGNYRIELFNKWGAGHNDAWNGVKDSPFGTGGEKTEEPVIGFTQSFEVVFTIVSLNGFTAGYTCCDSGWNSSWPDASTPLNLFTNFAPAKNVEYQITFEGSRADGMINLIEMQNLAKAFPKATFTLNKVECDNLEVSFDATKILYGDLEDKGNYRIELYNTFGSSKDNSAFAGETEGKVPALGFTSSTTVSFTVNSLY